jgi:hypothetical protein
MDGFVCTFKNNSNQRQEIDVFESSTLGGGSSDLNVQWNFRANYVNYTKTGDSVYSPVSRLWWDQAFYAKNGTFGIRVYLTDGSTLVIDEVNNPILVDITSGDLQNFLNDPAFRLEQVGTWTITQDEEAVFNISVDVSQTFIETTGIAQTAVLNYGVESISVEGGGVAPTFDGINVFPPLASVAPTVPGNRNVSVQSTLNFSYNDFLWSTIQRTYDIKNFQIYSASKTQLLEPFLFDRTLATGKLYQKVLTPTIDPYQDQNYIVTPPSKGYILDGFTKIKYTIEPNTEVRLILDYTYIDISTPLMIKQVKPKLNKDFITPEFVNNMEKGFDKFGCEFLIKRSKVLSEKLQWLIKGKPPHPEFSNQSGTILSNVIPCWGCIDGQIEQYGMEGGSTGFTNSNIEGWCGSYNGNDMYDSPTHPALEDCSGSNSENYPSNDEPSEGGGNNPKWQEQIKAKLLYIKKLLISYDCMPREEVEKMEEFESIGTEFRRKNLWMPSDEFVQHQIDTEQGAAKLFQKHDFPIEKE